MKPAPAAPRQAAPATGVHPLPLAAVRQVAEGTVWLSFVHPPAVHCEPGQFFMLSPAVAGSGVFLGRPLSIGDVQGGNWRFLVRALGRGTAWLRGLEPGAALRLVGPLGRPFERRGAPVHRMVAGGVGLAPFFYLARRLRAERPSVRIELLYGERSAAAHAAFDPDEAALFDHVERFTDDASRGTAGTVLEGLENRGREGAAAWYACGPSPMLRVLARWLEERGVTGAQFSLEERMGCGFGVCQACIVPRRAAPPRYRLLCTEGPVLDPRTVAW